jgi:hypothetical protein
MKKITLLWFLLPVALLYLWYNYNHAPQHTTSITNKETNFIKDKLYLDVDRFNNKAYRQTKEIKKESLAKKEHKIFEEIDIDELLSKREPIDGVKPIGALRIKKDSIKRLEVGERVLLPSIDGSEYMLKIKDKTTSSRGNVSIDGSFSENGAEYSAVLTEGVNGAFISFNTPEGTYEVEIIDEIGYVYLGGDITKAKIDPNKTDEMFHH